MLKDSYQKPPCLYWYFQVVQQLEGCDEPGASSSDGAPDPAMSFGAMASNTEYFKRKRNNFIRAWEEMILDWRGMCCDK